MSTEGKGFLFKFFNLCLAAAVLFIYQGYAVKRQERAEAYEKELTEYKKAESAAQGEYNDGVYEGSGMGYGGEVKIRVTVKDHAIEKVEILSAENETPEYLSVAELLLEDIAAVQSADVDVVTGATLSSNGILDGAKEALEKAER